MTNSPRSSILKLQALSLALALSDTVKPSAALLSWNITKVNDEPCFPAKIRFLFPVSNFDSALLDVKFIKPLTSLSRVFVAGGYN